MIYAEILAGGKGTRMGNTELPKQFLSIGDKPIIIHTIEQFLLNSKINKIIVVIPKDWVNYTEDLIKKYISNNSNIEITIGGSTRNETIMNGIKYIEKKYGINDDDIIITHDSVRPFITGRIIDDNIKAAKKYDAIDTVIPATDTIIEVEDDKVTKIPERKYMYQGQTPQTFNIKKLVELYNSLTNDEKDILTDACKIFVIKGKKVGIVLGEVYNIKITTIFDLKVANAIVEDRIND